MCTDYRSVGLWNSGVLKEKPVTENKLNSWQQALIYIGASVAVGKCNLYCGEMAIFAKDNAFLPRNRIRDGQVLTRDVSICQMWLEWEE